MSPGSAQASSATPARVEAALLALLLGDFGFHKFYLGRTRQGLLYLAFCWTFVPGILGIFEGLGYLLMSDRAFAARFGGQTTSP